MLSFTINRSCITILYKADVFSIDESHINYGTIRDELKKPVSERDVQKIVEWASVKRAVEIMSEGRVTVTNSEVCFDGQPVHNYMAKRMMDLLLDGFDLTPWARFMNNVYENPAKYAHDELYEWMEKAEMPLTDDGHFLAFKKVREDFTDCHTGKFDHSPGTIIEMPREQCDPIRTNHCSTGFHFCSVGYLSQFSGQRVVIVKINPRDVTSIPNDYGYTKGRCCHYEVVAELASESAARDKVWKKGVVNLEDPAEFPKEVLAQVKFPAAAGEPETLSDIVAEALDNGSNGEADVTSTEELPEANDLLFKTSDGRVFSPEQVTAALEEASAIRAAARELNIGESTLRGWKKKLEG